MSQFGFASIGMSSTDKLQFVGFPSAFDQVFQNVVAQNWPKTIKKVMKIGDALEIKLHGDPWFSEDESERIQSRTLIKALIIALGQQKWLLYGSSNLKDTADTMFFRYDANVPPDGSLCARFVISLSRNDRLQVIDAPSHITDCVRVVLTKHWPHGLQKEKKKSNADEFKLYGSPWWSDSQDGISARFVMCKLFEALIGIGWRVQIAIDMSRRKNDKSVLIFQRCAPTMAPIFCLSLNYTDLIRFINAPQDVIQALTAKIRRCWPLGISKQGPRGTSIEIELNGNPWSYGLNGHDGTHGRVLLCHLLSLCASMGWYIILSADVSAQYVSRDKSPDYPLDVHSWWFMRMESVPQQFATAPLLAPSQSIPNQFGMSGEPIQDYGFSADPPSYSEVVK